MSVSFIHITPEAEKVMGYCARVSNPSNQDNPNVEKLLAYCIQHGHWSVFEMASLCVEIRTSRAISPQILRHRSFSFQEFSQRYASPTGYVSYEARKQDEKNRQNSTDDLPESLKRQFKEAQETIWSFCRNHYQLAIKHGIAKECARMLLPMNTETTLYMHGTIRSWIHYINLRTTSGTQKEHRDLALDCQSIFSEKLPTVALALGWKEGI